MLEVTRDFPLYDDENELIYYKVGNLIDIKDKVLAEQLILSGKCALHDPREKEVAEAKIIDDYEKKIDPPKKRKKRKS